ncbi:CrcB family protein [Lactobacillus kunkeei]|uniref:Fluoride-specific ion channel FluC n=1 Tax=Apilactobacillus nanyangensis TaxID=2799579 RepID=A0ABT0HXH2_9LACO|nr:CrcB family protein [Apilactobacillus nanyangensis]MBC6389307.1 CrcB family protein [Apilactobacillus kunkeei]MCK8610989.1 CrcB family protein [Apilactobacillus nanyangensis]TMS99831.1 CrcB family protein [Apilactobacillus kunkeei]TMT03182.1 CrcB family protein [Apilactobacillus kunkeei]
MIQSVLIVGLGAAVGSLIRYGVTNGLKKLFNGIAFPVATFFINITGSFLLGLVNGQLPKNTFILAFSIAVLGGYTTFSTYMNETVQLSTKKKVMAYSYYLLSALLGILAALLGYMI